jgi:hypothetical protein
MKTRNVILSVTAGLFLCPVIGYTQIVNWSEIMRRLASGGSTGNEYGCSVSISGDYAVVGAYEAASAYVLYRNQGGTDNWGQVKKLVPTGAGTAFGVSVSISGDNIAVGDVGAGMSNTGAAFVFNRNQGGTDNWGQVTQITASDANQAKYFGYSIAIDGNYLVVGSYRDYGDIAAPVVFAGAAYIYNKDLGGTNHWGEVKKIISSDRSANDYFGTSVSISGDYVVVGATGETLDQSGGASLTNAGAAYIFYRNQGTTNSWGQQRKIVASDRTANNFFGQSVSINGYYATVGAYIKAAAYVYYNTQGGTNNWGQVIKLIPTGETGGRFGYSVSMTNNYIIVGAPYNIYDESGGSQVSGAGAAYVFKKGTGGTGDWSQQRKLVGSSRVADDNFGQAVLLTDQYAISGAGGVSNSIGGNTEGQAYIIKNVTQSYSVQATGVKSNQFTVSWNNGNGTARIVFIKQSSGNPEIPVNKTTYNASTVFGSGSQIGSSGWYCVYKGTGSTVTVTNLTPATNYRIIAYEFFGNAGAEYYFTFYNSTNLIDQVSGIDLSAADINVANSVIINTTSEMQYSLNSTNGSDGSWYDCSAGSTTVQFASGNVYIRQKSITSNFRLIASIPAAPVAPAFTIDYQNEKTNEQIPVTIEYNNDNNFDIPNSDGTGSKIDITPGTDVYFRVKATSTTLPGVIQHLDVPGRPVLSLYTIDYLNESTVENIASGVEYSTQSDLSGAVSGNELPVDLIPGTNLYFRKKATSASFVSEVFQLTVAARPSVSTSYTVNYVEETTNENVSTNHEYSTNPALAVWISGAGLKIQINPGIDLYFRQKASISSFASESQHLVVPARPSKPSITINFQDETTNENITTDIEYSLNSDLSEASAGLNLVIPLTPGTDIYFRVLGTVNNFTGEVLHLVVPVRPDSPVISISDKNASDAVFKKSLNGTGEIITVTDQVEYSTDGGITWTQITEYTEVDARSIKIIIARKMAKVNAFTSIPSGNLDYQIPVAMVTSVEDCNGSEDSVQVKSNTDNGYLYIVHEEEIISNISSLNAALTAGKAARAEVHTANTNISIFTDRIVPGTYYAYASNLMSEISARSDGSITIHPIPEINLGNDIIECEGNDVILDAGPGYSSYDWFPGGEITQTISITENGDYSVRVTDENGCVNKDTIKLIYSVPFSEEKICLVTIDLQSGRNLIVWEKTPDQGIVSYIIHRQTGVLGEYEPIDTVPYNNLSVYKDETADPEKRQYVYKLTIIDTCGNGSDILVSPYHKPLFLQYVSTDNGVNLAWEKYEVERAEMDFVTYKIYRGSDSTNLQYFDEVSGDLRVYTDNDPNVLQGKYYYRVAGVKSDACYPTSGKKADSGPYSHSMSNIEDNRFQVGIDGLRDGRDKLEIFPNPFSDFSTIRFNNPGHDQYRIILRDAAGKVRLIKENITDQEIKLYRGKLSPGYYYVEVAGREIYRGIVIIE